MADKEHNNLTVAICAYNAGRYIIETLQCIIEQSYQRFNLLIVNDASTDNTVEVIERFFQQNPRDYSIEHFTENQGLAAGRACVEHKVKTKYILFIDADDCPYPTLVEELHKQITSDNDLMAVGCYHSFIDSESRPIRGGIFLGATSKKEFLSKAEHAKLIFMQPTAIIDREVAIKVGGRNIDGFPEGKPRYADLCEDLDLWCRMSDLYLEGRAIIVIPKVLSRYRKHNAAMSTNSLNMRLRMKHIKQNLRLRRAGLAELSFIEFRNNISAKELRSIERESVAGDMLRNGVMQLSKGNILQGGYNVICSIIRNPQYFWQKIRANSRLFR